MRALLDTHALLWWLDGDRRLSRRARAVIANERNTVLVSAASAWEIASFDGLDITVAHGQRAGSLPGLHRDPFDRMLIAQAQAENLPLLTNETVFAGYGIRRIW